MPSSSLQQPPSTCQTSLHTLQAESSDLLTSADSLTSSPTQVIRSQLDPSLSTSWFIINLGPNFPTIAQHFLVGLTQA
jgi:hypothetical protein